MKNVQAYEVFNRISDIYVEESYIPGAEAMPTISGRRAPGHRAPGHRGKRTQEEGLLRRFMNSGWGVACLSLAVAFSVLAGIVWAGQREPGGPVTPPSNGTLSPTEAHSEEPTIEPETTDSAEITLAESDTEWVTAVVTVAVTDADTTASEPTIPDDPILEDPIPDPDVDAVLAVAQPMTPDTPADSLLLGETALLMWCTEDGSRLRRQVTRIAVYRDGTDPYIHYLYADVLSDDGRIRQTYTVAVNGFFILLEFDGTLVLATMEGTLTEDGTGCDQYGTMEAWLSWTDADDLSAEDMGEIRLQRRAYDGWSAAGLPMDVMDRVIVKRAHKAWSRLPVVLRDYADAEVFGVLVDFVSGTNTPRVYTYTDRHDPEAVKARALATDTDYFDTLWDSFVQRLRDRAAGKDPTAG